MKQLSRAGKAWNACASPCECHLLHSSGNEPSGSMIIPVGGLDVEQLAKAGEPGTALLPADAACVQLRPLRPFCAGAPHNECCLFCASIAPLALASGLDTDICRLAMI